MNHPADFNRALLGQYWRGMRSRGAIALLAGGLCLNLLIHHLFFNVISDTFKLYQSMTAILFGLSIDFYSLALIMVSAETYERFRSGNIYRDLDLSGIAPWPALKPLIWIVFWMSLAGALVQLIVGAVVSPDASSAVLPGLVAGVIYGAAGSLFLALFIVLANLLRLPRLWQLVIQVAIGFALILNFDWMTLLVGPHLSSLPASNLLVKLVAGGNSSEWQMHSVYYSYYLAILVQSVFLLPVIAIMYRRARTLAPRVLR